MYRKSFLKTLAVGGAAALGLPPAVLAQQAIDAQRRAKLSWGRLKFSCEHGNDNDWNVHPQGDLNFIDQVDGQTVINIQKEWLVGDINDIESMSQYPFLFMHAESPPMLEDRHRANLREYFKRGGFLFAEDCVIGKTYMGLNNDNDHFFLKMIEEFPKILPEARVERLPFDHPVFHSMYHFQNGMPHMQGTPHGLHGITWNGRVVALLSPSDLHCGWTNGDHWFGEGKSAQAFQMGINIYTFAMTQLVG